MKRESRRFSGWECQVVDTNVLVYALDRREPEKRERAREVLRRVGGAGTAALPAQVLSEFGGACLRKLEPRPDAEAIRREVERLMLAFPVLPLTGPVVLEALRGVGEHMLSYYEAQISGRSPAWGRWPWS
jgi:predicted nucleic acid-binding protein